MQTSTAQVECTSAKEFQDEFSELLEFELAVVGGGIGDVILG